MNANRRNDAAPLTTKGHLLQQVTLVLARKGRCSHQLNNESDEPPQNPKQEPLWVLATSR